jgi:hypothetical protein
MYRSCVQHVLVYASETWAVKVDNFAEIGKEGEVYGKMDV